MLRPLPPPPTITFIYIYSLAETLGSTTRSLPRQISVVVAATFTPSFPVFPSLFLFGLQQEWRDVGFKHVCRSSLRNWVAKMVEKYEALRVASSASKVLSPFGTLEMFQQGSNQGPRSGTCNFKTLWAITKRKVGFLCMLEGQTCCVWSLRSPNKSRQNNGVSATGANSLSATVPLLQFCLEVQKNQQLQVRMCRHD